MKDLFRAWYPISLDERQKLVSHGLVVIDTNVLLALYRMSATVRDDVMTLLSQLGTRLWIPHQVALEFHRNRLGVIFEQEQTDRALRKSIAEAQQTLETTARDMRDHPVIDRAEFGTVIQQAFDQITGYLNKATAEPYLSLTAAIDDDPILERISELLLDKVGPQYSDEALIVIKKEADRRYQSQRPPGYLDGQKEGDNKYGDYIIWRQMLDEAAARKLSVLFITNDQKEDWYQRVHGRTVGARVELICEMHEISQARFHIQTLAMFIKTAPSTLGESIGDNTVSEIDRLGIQSTSDSEDASWNLSRTVASQLARVFVDGYDARSLLRGRHEEVLVRRRLDNLDAEITQLMVDIRSSSALGTADDITDKHSRLAELRNEYTMLRSQLEKLIVHEAMIGKLNHPLTRGIETESDAPPVGSDTTTKDTATLRPGDLIEHDSYGLGRVLEVIKNSDGDEAKVDFGQEFGVKQLLLRYAHIRKF